MKTVILAGGLGTRLSEETVSKPKPMVEVGDYPILWHIMKIYSHYGYNDFILLCGYKANMIKSYFTNFYINNADIQINLESNEINIIKNQSEDWKVTILNTGVETLTGSRIKMAKDYILNDSDDEFMVTYGDGVSDVNIKSLLEFHRKSKKTATLTAVQPMGRFGTLSLDDSDNVNHFIEKQAGDGGWVNGGFFVFNKNVFDYIPDRNVMLEEDPLLDLVKDKQLAAYKHTGFWKPMDTLRDNHELNKMWASGKAPWKIWK
ncbi:Glucose-1-phosphate cytidylyltransferase [Anaerobiospirillum thomasii]|uniref:glucose-1-phosphate cytidylyltransferase n=1 Tax=Anaerobiospirillum thomasii TaxID=179995 RepID=UPI000D8757EC|nr:glucose-1-phosphate cytidylyltransferase [Anaerobiospirillum thomasii]SPT68349.1 Glucose-1-phosphate cytidylyltransferase [Anaerobiospirillum thomasii]